MLKSKMLHLKALNQNDESSCCDDDNDNDDEQKSIITTTMDSTSNMVIVKNHIYFYDQITDPTVRSLIANLYNTALTIANTSLTTGLNPCSINLHLNSPGGSLSGSLAVIQAIENIQKGKQILTIGDVSFPLIVNTYIEGEADSGASLIAVIGNKRYISKYGVSLIHSMYAPKIQGGNPDEIKETAENMDKLNKIYKKVYLEHSKLSEDELTEILKHEKYYTPEELLGMGIVDEIMD